MELAANDIIIDEDMMKEDFSRATASNLPEPHEHGPDCYRLDCPHERGDHTDSADDPDGGADCGYVEAVGGVACDYECSICSEENDVITITEFEELDADVRHQEVPVNTPQDALNLPDRLKARGFTGEDAETEILVRNVTWELIEKDGSLTVYDEEETRPCIYYYQASLPEQYQRDEGVSLPEIEVWYGMALRKGTGRNADPFAAANQALLNFMNSYGGSGCAEYDPDAGCVRLLADVTISRGLYIYSGSELTGSTLDLNGNTLNGPDSYTIYLNQSIFSLIDSTGTGELQGGESGSYNAVTVYDASQLTLKGVTISGDGSPNKVLSVSDPSGTRQGSILTVEDCVINGAVMMTGRAKLVVEGDFTADLFLVNADISIRNGVTLDLSNLETSEIVYGTRNITILPEGEWDTDTPLVKTKSGVPAMYFEMTDPPEGYYLANVVEGGFRTWTLKEKLPDELTVTFTIQPEHVSIPAEPRRVGYDKTYVIVFTPDPGYVVKSGNVTVRQFVDGSWLKRGHSYDQNTNTLTVENVQHNLEISVIENIQLTYDDKPTGGSIVVYGGNSAPLEADKVVAPNARIKVVATPENGYSLSKILVNGTEVQNNEVFTVTEPSEIRAEFVEAVNPPDPPEIPQQDIRDTTVFAGYQHMISAVNGEAPLIWSVSDEEGNRLPAGLKLNPDSGVIYGTPVESGTFSFTVTVQDANGASDSRQFSILIREPQMIHVTGVELSQRTLNLTAGNTAVLTAKVIPEDAFYKKVVWRSANPEIVTVDQNGLVTAIKNGTADITVITEDNGKTDTCTVTVTGGRSSSGGSGGGSVSSGQALKPDDPELAVVELPVGGSPAGGMADDGATTAAMAEAEAAAAQKNRSAYGIAVQYDLRSEAAFDGFSITIKRETLERMIEKGVKWLTINTETVDLTFDLAALKEIVAKSAGDITLTAERVINLAGDMGQAIGNRPVYRLKAGYTGEDGSPAVVDHFGTGRVTVMLAYTPDGAEQVGGLYLVHGDENGGVEWLTWSGFDRDGKGVSGSTGHFSFYGVGYRPAEAFADTADHPGKSDIDFAVSRGLLSGMAPETEGAAPRFEPDRAVTRSMFAEALGRLTGINPADYPYSGRFQDVPSDAAYGPYAEWAAGAGIMTNAVGSYFNPDVALTREQMALILKQYADRLGYRIPVCLEAAVFSDNSQISSGSVRDAVGVMQQAGIMESKADGRFAPKETVSRAEAAGILRKFINRNGR